MLGARRAGPNPREVGYKHGARCQHVLHNSARVWEGAGACATCVLWAENGRAMHGYAAAVAKLR